MDSPPIFRLVPELLLRIFTILAQDTDAVLAFSVLCCKRWRPLAQSVLYSDIFLSGERLVKFAKEGGGGSNNEIPSLKLHLGPVHVDQYDPKQTIETTEGWLNALRGLLPRITRMVQLESLSVSADFPLPYLPCSELSSIFEALSTTCVALEIDWRHSTFIQQRLDTAPTATAHMCDSIRAVLGRTLHLRLRLPKVCPALFGEQDEDGFHLVGAPQLKDCIVNFSQRTPGTSPRAWWAASNAHLGRPGV